MKWLVTVLLGLNLLAFGWQWQVGSSAVEMRAPVPIRSPGGLTLLSELSAEQMPARRTSYKAPAAAVPIRDTTALRLQEKSSEPATEAENEVSETPAAETPGNDTQAGCLRVGGILDASQAERIRELVQRTNGTILEAGEESFSKPRYWVLLPPFPSAGAARKVATALAAVGITDSYLIPAGENRNALSLGVFSTEHAARRRVERLHQVYPAGTDKLRTEQIALTVKRRYLVTDLAPPLTSDSPLYPLVSGLTTTSVTCPTP